MEDDCRIHAGSLSVNRYRWINIWMAILGQLRDQTPVFFDLRRTRMQKRAGNFS
ncbi:hypothetical protein A8H26_00035 [Pluralibacter gergoviae]|nr:hypothetical protein A8H26_00035 [Pluralibacter gergoviae]